MVVKSPKHISSLAEKLNIEVCARYVHGRPVRGCLTVMFRLLRGSVIRDSRITETLEIEGCRNVSYPIKQILESSSVYGNIYLSINATVVEEGSGETVNTLLNNLQVESRRYKIRFEDTPQYFKRGILFMGKVQVMDITGGSVRGLKISVYKDRGGSITAYTNSLGFITFTFSDLGLTSSDDSCVLRARLYGHAQPEATKTVKLWYSPSDSSIQITEAPQVVECGGSMPVEVRLSKTHLKDNRFIYQIVVQNKIAQHGQIDADVNLSFSGKRMTFVLKLPSSVWGVASLLIYIISGEEEIVADSRRFKIEQCLENNVTFEFSQATCRPGKSVVMSLTAQPGSLCAYGVTDKSVQFFGGSNAVTMNEVISQIPSRSTTTRITQEELCGEGTERSTSERIDAREAFQQAQLIVFSNLKLDMRRCVRITKQSFPWQQVHQTKDDDLSFLSGYFSEKEETETTEGRDKIKSIGTGIRIEEGSSISEEETMLVDSVRSFFPETWLWDIIPINSSGTVDVVHKAPDTMTEWIGRAVCTSEQYGLGISNTASMHTLQPFFVSLSLPYSALRGETLLLPVSVFNYLSECLKISLELEESPNYDIESDNRFEMFVCEKKVTHHFPLKAKSLGRINITVTATSIDRASLMGNNVSSAAQVRDKVIREMLVEPEGKEEEHAFNHYKCLKPGEDIEATYQWTVPADIVSDSLKIDVAVSGDVMGPALTWLEPLLRLPTGCGEQNMVKMAPDIYILQYLTKSHKLNQEIREKALEHIRQGYQNQLRFRHPDGSYSAFGTSDRSGSTWLTAFVLKSFSQASRFITINQSDLRTTREWLANKQLENGCFRNVGRVYNKALKGGLSEDFEALAPITAYSLVALLEAGYNASNLWSVKAALCLLGKVNHDAYSAALTGYAFSVLGEYANFGKSKMATLRQFKRVDGDKAFWTAGGSKLTYSHQVIRPIDIETTAYALLAHLHMSPDPVNDLDTLLPIVRWLTAQRNPSGGFLSTQDTVVALQALAEFADVVKSELGDVDIDVQVNSEEHNFKINSTNHLLLQKEPVTKPSGAEKVDVLMKGSGTGCCFVQTSMRYYVLNVTRRSTNKIYLNLTVLPSSQNVCNRKKLRICTRYEGPDEGPNMALLDVKMVTGWSAVQQTVEKLQQDSKLSISKVEIEKKHVFIYFDELFRGNSMCLTFEVKQDIEVINSKPATASIYDYYDNQDVFHEVEYSLQSDCRQK